MRKLILMIAITLGLLLLALTGCDIEVSEEDYIQDYFNVILIDKETGCHYMAVGSNRLAPRYNKDGVTVKGCGEIGKK